jgi:hypothetical protein
VFEATDKSQAAMDSVSYIQSSDQKAEGAEVVVGGTVWAALFAVQDPDLTAPVRYNVSNSGFHQHLITDVTKNEAFHVTVVSNGQTIFDNPSIVSTPQGTLSFSFATSGPAQVVAAPTGQIVDVIPPAVPQGLSASGGDQQVILAWDRQHRAGFGGIQHLHEQQLQRTFRETEQFACSITQFHKNRFNLWNGLLVQSDRGGHLRKRERHERSGECNNNVRCGKPSANKPDHKHHWAQQSASEDFVSLKRRRFGSGGGVRSTRTESKRDSEW